MMFFKKIFVPKTNELKEIDAVQLWEVRWTSLKDDWTKLLPEVECFTSENAAYEFAKSLKNAFNLVRCTAHTEVKVTKAK